MKSFYKYIFVFFVSFTLLTSAVTVAVNAEQPPKPTISAQSVTTQKGEDIFVKIDVSSNPGVAFALIEVEYSDELNLIDIWDEGCFGSPLFENDLDANPVHLSWDHSEGGDNALDGKSTITVFVANRGIENVSDIELVLTKDEIGGEILGKVTVNETLYRKNMVMATFEVDTDKINDVVYVEARIAQTENTYTNNRDFVYVDMIKTDILKTQIEVVGDVNRDGKLSADDVTALRNYLVKNEVEIDTAAADVNSDGKLNGKDVVLLGRLVRNM